MKLLTDKTALVTGASRGIGLAIARRLAGLAAALLTAPLTVTLRENHL